MIRIGLISDTHEADEPLAVIEQLRAQKCEWNIHLGDIGGSETSRALVREFKENGHVLDRLTTTQRTHYDALIRQGRRDVLAWLQVTVGDDPVAAATRRQETAISYSSIIMAMRSLPNHRLLAGNVEHINGRGPLIAEVLERHQEALVMHPLTVALDGGTLVLWPSLHPRPSEVELRLITEAIRHEIRPDAPVFLISHEQMFKGPIPARYRERVEANGRPPASIPYYEPNTTRMGMLHLLRVLPFTTELALIHGHVHDTDEVIATGAPYLRDRRDSSRLALRLFGLGHRDQRPASGQWQAPRRASNYCIPAGRVAILSLDGSSYTMELLPPPPSAK
jgi:hypothetical protein